MLRVVCLVEHRAAKALLLKFKRGYSVAVTPVILEDLGVRAAVGPVHMTCKGRLLLRAVVQDRSLRDVPTSEDARLQVLVLAVLTVQVSRLDERPANLDRPIVRVPPIHSGSNERSVFSIDCAWSVLRGSLPMELLRYLLFGRDLMHLSFEGLALGNRIVLGTLIVGLFVAAQVDPTCLSLCLLGQGFLGRLRL